MESLLTKLNKGGEFKVRLGSYGTEIRNVFIIEDSDKKGLYWFRQCVNDACGDIVLVNKKEASKRLETLMFDEEFDGLDFEPLPSMECWQYK